MHTQANDDYVPFGDEWRREMMRWRKADLVEFLRRQLIVLNDLQQEQRGRTEFAEVLRGLKLRGVITDADVERLEREGVE
ncbi:MAG: hypothetical protein WAP54_01240 [Bacteroidales bacterium]|jgi:hypothetical protein